MVGSIANAVPMSNSNGNVNRNSVTRWKGGGSLCICITVPAAARSGLPGSFPAATRSVPGLGSRPEAEPMRAPRSQPRGSGVAARSRRFCPCCSRSRCRPRRPFVLPQWRPLSRPWPLGETTEMRGQYLHDLVRCGADVSSKHPSVKGSLRTLP